MKRLLTLPCLLLAMDVAASCPSLLPTEPPQLPDGHIATEADMRESHDAMKAYITNIEDYLSCWELALLTKSYNNLVNEAHNAADAYNQELRHFKQQTADRLASN